MVNIFEPNSIGTIEGLEPTAYIFAILSFIENHLSGFVIKYFSEYRNISNEIGITQKLEMYLNPFLKVELSTFNLTKEYVEDISTGQSPQSDLGFYLDGEDLAIFCIEAKRLPTPGSQREKEYIIGHWNTKNKYVNSGGIERFKKGIHGRGLTHSAIIGYVQQNDFEHWYKQVNIWIDELIQDASQEIEWNQNDKLNQLSLKPNIAKFQSVNKRTNDSITLFHFWLNLVTDLANDDELINGIRIIVVE